MLFNPKSTASRLSLLLVALTTGGFGCLGSGPSPEEVDVGHDESAACAGYPEWQEGQQYNEGAIVNYQGSAYIAEHDNPGYIPTVSTYFWEPYTACSDAPDPGPIGPLPDKVVAGYYPNWTPDPIRIREINSNYNLIYLFHAKPVGGAPGTTGAVTWEPPGDDRGAATNLNADIQYARTVQGRRIILSVGGAGNGMSFPNREKSQTFVDSVVGIYNSLGGFDGLDWNTFEADQDPDTDEMIWISLELKRRFPGFIITAPPAPWNNRDKTFCKAMVDAGAMDYAAPQYYDGPDLDQQWYIADNVADWVSLLGPTHVVVGFGIWDAANYMSIDEAIPTWNQLESEHPKLRGAFDWQIHNDEFLGWPFADRIGPLVRD
ncbi:glycosyl hydrolase family 18 protein [Sorangium sp. So ce131]|uniref:glycosyl hydrolase family 18 protein n=1 Tax=Sorangium sp. So ce131 TaxID=3133282 RepID=UPI003F616514